jgi:hypothetical protein
MASAREVLALSALLLGLSEARAQNLLVLEVTPPWGGSFEARCLVSPFDQPDPESRDQRLCRLETPLVVEILPEQLFEADEIVFENALDGRRFVTLKKYGAPPLVRLPQFATELGVESVGWTVGDSTLRLLLSARNSGDASFTAAGERFSLGTPIVTVRESGLLARVMAKSARGEDQELIFDTEGRVASRRGIERPSPSLLGWMLSRLGLDALSFAWLR